jgi:hypothetical protein
MQKKVKVALPAFLRLARKKSVGQGRGGGLGGDRAAFVTPSRGPSIKNYRPLISCSERPE